MSVVNFTINKTLERQIRSIIREKGYHSKAEFFRVAAISYMNSLQRQMSDEEEFAYLAARLERVARKKLSRKKIPSLRKQLEEL